MILNNDSIFTVRYHNFKAERGSQIYGNEWDFSWFQKIDERYFAELKYANFDSSGFFKDTEKVWFSIGAKLVT